MKTWTRIAFILAALVFVRVESAAPSGLWEPINSAAAAAHPEAASYPDYGPIPSAGGVPAAAAATVSGTISRQDNGDPVPNAAVTVSWPTGSQTEPTDSTGDYSVSGVPTGGRV